MKKNDEIYLASRYLIDLRQEKKSYIFLTIYPYPHPNPEPKNQENGVKRKVSQVKEIKTEKLKWK